MSNPSIADLIAEASRREAHLGRTRLILIDGPAGSGKTTLAERIGAAVGAQVVHGDDIYEGWDGLETMLPILEGKIIRPLVDGSDAAFQAWDWHASARGSMIDVPASDWLVIEGVGVAQRSVRPFASLVLFVEAPWSERLRRGIERDGEAVRDEWERWQVTELIHHEVQQTRAASHIEIDGTQPIPDHGDPIEAARAAQADAEDTPLRDPAQDTSRMSVRD